MRFKLTTLLSVCCAFTLVALSPGEGLAAEKTPPVKRKVAKTSKTASLKKTPAKRAQKPQKKTVAQKNTHRAAQRTTSRGAAHQVAHAPVSLEPGQPALQSTAVVVQDQSTGEILLEKNSHAVLPIASITKLMTAMVVLDARLSLNDTLTIGEEDVDTLKRTTSRLKVGTRLSREDMLLLALMSSENRAASALSRHYPGGAAAFIAAMNRKALDIGLQDTHFEDPTGLTAANVSSARDLGRMVAAAAHYPLIRELSTTESHTVQSEGREIVYHNTNPLVRNPASGWEIALQKTGFIREAGKCLVMQAWLGNRPVVIVLLDSWGKLTRIGDANRIKHWIESVAAHDDGRPSAALSRPTPG